MTSAAMEQILNKQVYTVMSSAFAKKHIPMDTVGLQWMGFCAEPMPRCYNQDEFRSCKGVCEERTWAAQLKNPHY
jgi:hypothetical protein